VTPVVKELYLLRSLHRPDGDFTSTVDQGAIERRIQGFGDGDRAVPTTSPGTFEGTWAQKPLASSAGDATAAVPPYEMGDLLRDYFTESLGTGSTFSSQGGSAPTGITITPASATGFNVGDFLLMSTGEASMITDKSGGVLTCPQLTAATNVASSVIYAGANYRRKGPSDTFYTRTWDHYVGRKLRHLLMGAAYTIELEITRDQVVKFMLKGTATDALEYNLLTDPNGLAGSPFSLAPDVTVPVDGKGARSMIDSIPIVINTLKVAFMIKPVLRPSLSGMNQADGYAFDLEPQEMTGSGALADNDDISGFQSLQGRIRASNVCSIFYQKGSNPTGTFALCAPAAQFTKVAGKHSNRMYEFDFTAKCLLPQLALSGANSALPALGFSYL
jgi:hypothetical protein